MTEALIIMGGMGLVIGMGLAVASRVFYVYVDPLILAVEEALPGANCGGCGLPGCSANAEAIVAGKSAPNSCVAAGPEVAAAIGEILGVMIEAKEPDIALPGCTYGVKDADVKYQYDGLADCKAIALLNGGMKVCTIGCIGFGNCVKACKFNALHIGDKGLPVVNEHRCTGCGACERACPKNIINLSSVTRRILLEYTTDMCTTPCQRSCPAGINISEYIRQIAMGDYHRAVQVIKERNPFPSVIGRICPRPCELDCRRKYIDEPVAINFLKRFASDYEKKMNSRILPYKAPETGKQIAVVGGGVEGLSTAFFSARLGHLPTVFEATSKLGGLLRNAISTYRLPHEILDWDIDGILEMGVSVEMGKTMGKDFTVASLLNQGFEAVFLASGGWDSRLAQSRALNIEKPVPGMRLLIDVFKEDQIDEKGVLSASDVVISGGGAIALKVAEQCIKNGVKKTTVLFRKTRDQINLPASDIDNIERKGVHVIFNAAITAIAGEDDRLLELEYTILDTLLKKNIPANTLIISAGRFPELIFTKTIQEDTLEKTSLKNTSATSTRWNAVEPGKSSPKPAHMGLFSKSHPVTDFSCAIKAINAGRKAAASIHQAMYKILISVPENVVTSESVVQNVDHVEDVTLTSRQIMPLCAVEDLDECKEIEKGFTQEAAQKEAERCLQCGLICYEKAQNQAALSADAA